MTIPSLEFYVESIRHLTSSVAIRRQEINELEQYLQAIKNERRVSSDGSYKYSMSLECKYVSSELLNLRAKQKHGKRMLAYFVAQQRDILDYYKATEELYEETL